MSLTDVMTQSFVRSLELYDDLMLELPESALAMRLPGIRSNPLGSQVWCVVGARETCVRAIAEGRWTPFACSLDKTESRSGVGLREALRKSGQSVVEVLADLPSFDDQRSRMVVDLLEHEAGHRGQLIRYLFALHLRIPAHWRAHYALD